MSCATRGRPIRRGRMRRWGAAACLGGSLASVANAGTIRNTDEIVRTAPEFNGSSSGSWAVTVPIERAADVEVAEPAAPNVLTPNVPAPHVPAPGALAPIDDNRPASVGIAASAAPVQDQTPPARPTPVLSPIQGPLTLDGKYLGDISGEVDPQGEGLVDAAGLMDLMGPLLSPSLRQTLASRIATQTKVNMDDLNMEGFSLSFDPLSLTFTATLSSEARAQRRIGFSQDENVDTAAFDQPANFSAGANITLAQQYSHNESRFSPLQGGVDMFANFGGFDGVTLTAGVDYDGTSEDRWQRREIRLTKDLFGSAVRLTAGEFAPPVESFQGSRRFLGLSAARAYSTIRPFQNIRPSGRRQFVLDRPALVVVEVNGVIVERIRLEAGPYSLGDFPFGEGANTVRLLVEDDTGQREIAVFDLFGGAGLLDPGVLDFGVSAGVLEQGVQLQYGSTLAATGFFRKGLSDVLTVGANAQAANGRGQVGGLATWGSGAGLFQFSGGSSHNADTGATGYIGAIDYLREVTLGREVELRLVASAQATSRFFQNAFDETAFNREQWRAAGQALVRVRDYSINVGAAFVKGRGQRDRTDFSLGLGRSFRKFAVNLAWQQGTTLDGRKEDRFGFTLTSRFGGRWSSAARYDSDKDFREVGISRAATGRLNDISGDVRLSQDDSNQALSADLRYVNNRFDAEVVSNRLVSSEPGGVTRQESLWRVSTMIGYADGALAVGRSAREGFVIASRHPTLSDSRVSLTDSSGYAIAHSGWLGPAMAGIDRGYGVRRFEIQADPLPPGYDLGAGVYTTFPGFGTGYHLVVGSDASHTARGVLMSSSGPVALAGGTLEKVDAPDDAEGKPFFTNRNGRFIADGLSPGQYRIVIQGVVVGTFVVPANVEGIADVGEIHAVQ